MASSSTSSIQKSFKYHVFISFRGEDTRKTFVGHLYTSLKQLGIHTFRDNEELEKGKRIDELLKAIEESKFFIIVFSKNYASSSWCLKELAMIMECKTKEQIVYPLFYDVNPAKVRKQSGEFGQVFAKHKLDEHVGKWKKALEDAGNLVGWDLRNRDEAEAINEIVEEISLKLNFIHSSNDENLIGMERRMQDLESSLRIDLDDDVRMIGIKGMGGIGKTTLARAIFDKAFFHFEGRSFVENIREVSKTHGLESLQQQVLSDVLNDKHMCVGSVYYGKRIMETRLPHKKVLLVLDDVDNVEQLEALAGNWFKEGSRIIITTRDEKVLQAHGVNENWIHDVSLLSDEEAISLFSRYAFKRDIPHQGYEKLSSEVVRYAAGLPLAIKVLGSHLCGEKEVVWIDALKRLKTYTLKETLEVLEISYVGLEDDHKEIFLDVACFMKGFPINDAIRMLDSRGFGAVYGLRILQQKSLITISNQRLSMHDRIEELGRNIVRRSHPDKPNKHSRLWIRKEIEDLFSNDAGTEATTCIALEQVEQSPEIVMKGLGNLKNLRVLLLSEKDDDTDCSEWKFDQANQCLPNALQFLNWEGYPLPSLPQSFLANNLVELVLHGSRIEQLWESVEGKVLKKLRFLDLSGSKLRTLHLGMTPNIERLDLEGCHNLTELFVPDGCLETLVHLNLHGCSSFRSLPFIKRLESLELRSLTKLMLIVESQEPIRYSRDNLPKLRFECRYSEEQPSSSESGLKFVSLNLQPRKRLDSISGSICGLQHLRHLTLYGCIPEVPNDLDQLASLDKLVFWSMDIRFLPDNICKLKQLRYLKFKFCNHLEELPEDLGWLEQLEELSLLCTGISRFPDSMCKLKRLKYLKLKSCGALEQLPEDLGQLECLEKLILKYCASIRDIPNSMCNMKRLRYFRLFFCNEIKKLPEELGNLDCLEELNIRITGISQLPQSISLMEGLRVVGSAAELLSSCTFATEIQTSENESFCYIQAVNNTWTPIQVVVQVRDHDEQHIEALIEAFIDKWEKEIRARRSSPSNDHNF